MQRFTITLDVSDREIIDSHANILGGRYEDLRMSLMYDEKWYSSDAEVFTISFDNLSFYLRNIYNIYIEQE
jgi:hypothetical protein